MRRGQGKEQRPGWFLAPAAAILALVAAFPLGYVLWLSLQEFSLLFDAPRFAGLENYQRLLADPRFWNAFYNTVYFTVVSVALELLLGLGIALALHGPFKGLGWLRALVLIPWAIPTVVSARMWEWMYNPEFGVLNFLLGVQVNWLGNPFWAMHAAIAMDVWKSTPFVALLLLAGLASIPQDLYRAARVDGAGSWTIFWRITLPLLMPLILIVLIFRTIDAFRVFDAIYVLTGGGPANSTETLSIYAYRVLFQTLEFGYGSTVAVIVFVSIALVTVFYARLLRSRMQ
jgi:multiple sugar transport system permease protein